MRPATVITDDSAVFWDAATKLELVAQRCGGCGVLRHPPRPMCPHCQSLDYEAVQLSGRGTLYSYALLHHPRHPAFDYPVVAALVDLDEGVRVVSNLVDVEPGEIRIGMPLEVTFEPTAGDGSVPVFRPARDAA
nr:Zn-ribbon domain-containing OB-fold protein [Frankia nepalensis]